MHVVPGKGNVSVNGKGIHEYLARETLVDHAQRPLVATNTIGQLDVHCFANGGGLSGQAGAIRMAIARALVKLNPSSHQLLRREGLLTRDPRVVERKKYGRPKARKRFQYSKR